MAGSPGARRRIGTIIMGVACIGVAAAVGWSVFGKRSDSLASVAPGDITASIDSASPKSVGPSGLPIPRFVSLKAEKVNVRRGPSSDHPVAWVFQRKGLPVEIVAEFENWRRVRDFGRRGRLDPAEHAVRKTHRRHGSVETGPDRATL